MTAEDYTRFLIERDGFSILNHRIRTVKNSDGSFSVSHQGVTATNSSGKYLAEGFNGQIYELRSAPALSVYSEVLSSVFLDSIGLPNISAYPVLLKRGTNGVPLAHNQTQDRLVYGLVDIYAHFDHTKNLTATIKADIPLKPYSSQDLSPEQKAEFLGHLLVHYILGIKKPLSDSRSRPAIGFTGEHFITTEITQAFSNVSPSLFEKYFKAFPFDISLLSKKEQETFLRKIDSYVSRIESLSKKNLENLIKPYFRASELLSGSNSRSESDYYQELVEKIQGLRSHLAEAIIRRASLPHETLYLFEKSKITPQRVHIHVPALFSYDLVTDNKALEKTLFY